MIALCERIVQMCIAKSTFRMHNRKGAIAPASIYASVWVIPAMTQDSEAESPNPYGIMERLADLHVHSLASDGALTPFQIVEAALRKGLAAVAIADHDTTLGIDEAIGAGNQFGVEVVPAIEISAIHGDRTEVHVLGYFIDHRSPVLQEALEVLQIARWERGRRMVEQLNEAGVRVNFDRVAEIAAGGAIGRPHVARALCEVGAASSMDSAFGKFLREGGVGYVPRHKVSPREAIGMIKASGGVACCAHPVKLKNEALLVEMIEMGLRAIEVYHPDHSPATSRYYRRFAEKRGLIITGGSDAHCFPNDIRPGIGDIAVHYEAVEELRNASAFGPASNEDKPSFPRTRESTFVMDED